MQNFLQTTKSYLDKSKGSETNKTNLKQRVNETNTLGSKKPLKIINSSLRRQTDYATVI